MSSRAKQLCVALAIGVAVRSSFGQTTAPAGLDALSDERLLNELAARNLGGLLDRAFVTNKVPPSAQQALRGRMALQRLANENISDLNEVRKLVAEYVDALPKLLPTMNDPQAMINDANLLIDNGIASDQNLLEYFGANGSVMTRLNPVAKGVQQLLARAQTIADERAAQATNDWPAMKKQWERADQQKTIAEYTRNIITFPLALSIDKADPERAKLLAASLEYLAQFDAEDNPERPAVRLYMGQMRYAQATPQTLRAALEDFAFIIKNGRQQEIGQQFDARFLNVCTQIALGDTAAAQVARDALQGWAKAANIDPAQLAIATAVLQYRLAIAADKPDDADAVLYALLEERPKLRGVILELMSSRIDPRTPVKQLSDLLLQSVIAKAEIETIKPQGQAFDNNAVARGVLAIRELLARPADTAGAKALRENCTYVLPFFLQKLGRETEAANAYLDFIDSSKGAAKNDRMESALNNAIAMVHSAYTAKPSAPDVTKVYERVLATAVGEPFKRLEFAYELGRRLQTNGNYAGAVTAFSAVPSTDSNFEESRYYLMVAVRQSLEKITPDDPAFAPNLQQLTALIDAVNTSITASLAAAPNSANARTQRTRLAQTQLLGGDVALRDQKNPTRALDLLKDFESTAAGLADRNALLGEVLLIRVRAYVQLDQVDQATDQLVKLAQQNPNGAGQVVYNLLQKLDEQITASEAANKSDQVAQLERNRAMLTPFLVTWASGHANPQIRKLAYTYSVFDADTQRRAAELSDDGERKKQLLAAALERFKSLDSADGVKQYLATLEPDKRAKARYDSQVKLGLGRTYFAMADWTNARLQFVLLFRDKVLGTGVLTAANAAGVYESKDNPSYWECMLKLIRCNLSLNENVDGMKGLLQEQQLIYGDTLGGERWKKEYVALLDELKIAPATAPAIP